MNLSPDSNRKRALRTDGCIEIRFWFCKPKQRKSIMRRREEKRKFHEAVVDMLYPPPPSSPPQTEDGDGAQGAASGGLQVDRFPDEAGDEVGDSTDEDESGQHKLSRAQRKRIRKKKLQEDMARRQKIVGPLLPSSSTKEDDQGGVEEEELPGVRRNSELGSDDVPHEREESAAFINQKRLKQRRAAKKLARDRLKSSEQQRGN